MTSATFELDSKDIEIHKALAASMSLSTLTQTVEAIRHEYNELAKSLEQEDLKNHLILLNIYAEELLFHLNPSLTGNSAKVH